MTSRCGSWPLVTDVRSPDDVIAASGLFYGDELPYTALQSRRRAVLNYRAALLRLPPVPSSGKGYYSFYQYQQPMVANYPLSSYNPAWNTRDFVSFSCSNATAARFPAGGGCHDGPDGGRFFGTAAAVAFVSTRCRAKDAGTELPAGPGQTETSGPGGSAIRPTSVAVPIEMFPLSMRWTALLLLLSRCLSLSLSLFV